MNTILMARIGYALSGLFAAFMLAASIAPKLLGLDVAASTLRDLGWPDGYVLMIGLIELACLGLFMWGGLWLRNAALRMVVPLHKPAKDQEDTQGQR